jgi:hypothetical protein
MFNAVWREVLIGAARSRTFLSWHSLSTKVAIMPRSEMPFSPQISTLTEMYTPLANTSSMRFCTRVLPSTARSVTICDGSRQTVSMCPSTASHVPPALNASNVHIPWPPYSGRVVDTRR